MMTIETRPVTPALIDDLDALFCSDKTAANCWCMWHVISVKDFHAGGAEQNRAQLTELIETDETPAGIVAYEDGEAKGWCAVGPRERYARALKTPTYRSKTEDPYASVWLVPCFLTHRDVRGTGLTNILLEAAVELARKNGAQAIDGFPFTNEKRRSGGQIHVGFESTFVDCGFEPLRRPSDSRVVMRNILTT